ncbi:hypothetical protein NXX31_25500 [Bacteroides thetaiotaomicron]|nr:hypothetical protein [Bacteroides thetaiotaomicron]MCA6013738.1 hypothetical protein [Bacteroides thetaiotaomicron]MCE8717128.1 hypothetical protein [Bacteroides thetaiotaomicron]MCS2190989.1 hypothetical protein [Bacteroides thetaiotaomicron]MCS2386556.1 hypothetical protein [Bacteroides thetaiotaomicron]MCS2687165.1 hypothetical protein [Bacteroides thetaiotaomicron]
MRSRIDVAQTVTGQYCVPRLDAIPPMYGNSDTQLYSCCRTVLCGVT